MQFYFLKVREKFYFALERGKMCIEQFMGQKCNNHQLLVMLIIMQ